MEEELRDREDRTSAALMTFTLLVGVTSGMTIAYIGLFVGHAPWLTAAAGLMLSVLAYVCRDRRWITALLIGACISTLLVWTVVLGGGFLVSHF